MSKQDLDIEWIEPIQQAIQQGLDKMVGVIIILLHTMVHLILKILVDL